MTPPSNSSSPPPPATQTSSESTDYDIKDIFSPYDNEPQEIHDYRMSIRSKKQFDICCQIGEGTYGKVYKAIDRKNNNRIVALKKILNHRSEGFPVTAIREMIILQKCSSPYTIPLYEVIMGRNSIYFVFEYMDFDLEALVRNPNISLSYSQIKCFLKQILLGLQVMHSKGYLHRDLKCSNILMNHEGDIKLADFGFARSFQFQRDFTNHRMTLNYRPPEILLGCRSYGPPADMWSIGCILAELLLKKTLLPAKTEFDQIHRIYQVCGVPNRHTWPEVRTYEAWQVMKPSKKYARQLKHKLRGLPNDAVDFIDRCLQMNPAERITCDKALKHHIFTTEPLPATREELPKYESCHSFTFYQEKKRKREQEKLNASTDSPLQQKKKIRTNGGSISSSSKLSKPVVR